MAATTIVPPTPLTAYVSTVLHSSMIIRRRSHLTELAPSDRRSRLSRCAFSDPHEPRGAKQTNRHRQSHLFPKDRLRPPGITGAGREVAQRFHGRAHVSKTRRRTSSKSVPPRVSQRWRHILLSGIKSLGFRGEGRRRDWVFQPGLAAEIKWLNTL